MNLLFWLLWLVLFVFVMFIMYARSFRSGYGSGLDLDQIVMIGIGGVLIASILVRYIAKRPKESLWILVVPLAFLILWYIKEEVLNIK